MGPEGRRGRYAGTDSCHMHPVGTDKLGESDDRHSKLPTSLWTWPESHTHAHTDNGHALLEPAVQGRQGHVRPICPLQHVTTVLIHRISRSLLRL